MFELMTSVFNILFCVCSGHRHVIADRANIRDAVLRLQVRRSPLSSGFRLWGLMRFMPGDGHDALCQMQYIRQSGQSTNTVNRVNWGRKVPPPHRVSLKRLKTF